MIPHIYNGNGTISVMLNGKMKPIDTAHKFYNEIKEAIKSKNWDEIPKLIDIADRIATAIKNTGNENIQIRDGEVYYKNTIVHNQLTMRMIEMSKDGFDIGHMVKFLDNLMLNPSYRAVNELYGFLEAGNIPITENGTFLAYKKIRADWKDIHSGTYDNSIGTVVEMPRNLVNEDSSVTCSAGLHVCSYDYLSHFGSSGDDRVVICEISPESVVSIPKDYDNTKMRVCKYKVIGEVEDFRKNNVLTEKPVFNTSDFNGRNKGYSINESTDSVDITVTI